MFGMDVCGVDCAVDVSTPLTLLALLIVTVWIITAVVGDNVGVPRFVTFTLPTNCRRSRDSRSNSETGRLSFT